MIPLFSLEQIQNDVHKFSTNLPSSFLMEWLKTSDTSPQPQDISILSNDCLNSQDSMYMNQISHVYSQATKTLLRIFNKHHTSKYLNEWHKKSQQIISSLQRLTTGIVKLSYVVNKKIRYTCMFPFIGMKTADLHGPKHKNGIEKLVKCMENIMKKHYVMKALKVVSEAFEEDNININVDVLQNTINKMIRTRYLHVIYECKRHLKITKKATQCREYNENPIREIQKRVSQHTTKPLNLKQSKFVQYLNPQTIGFQNSFSNISNKISCSKIKKGRYNNFASSINFGTQELAESQQTSSQNKINKPILTFSSPVRSKSRNAKIPPISSVCKPLIMSKCNHGELQLSTLNCLGAIQGILVEVSRTVVVGHLQKDINSTVLQDIIDTPQIFQAHQKRQRNNNFHTRIQYEDRSTKKSLQFKSHVGSPQHFKEIKAPKLFNKSRQNRRQQISNKSNLISLQTPSTVKSTPRKSLQFKSRSVKRPQNVEKKSGMIKQIFKVRMPAPFIEQADNKNSLIFDCNAYFNQ